MYIKSNTFSGEGFILAQADNYDTLSVKLTKKDALAGVANADGKFIVKQGTIYKNAGGRAIGIVFNSVDVTDGSSNVAIIIKGTVLIGKLPAIPTEAEAKQLKNIVFLSSGGKVVTYTTKFMVTFVDHDNALLKVQVVPKNGDAVAPTNPTRPEYTFTAWDKVFTGITADTVVKATYTIVKYTVRFLDHDDAVLKTEQVESGSAATAPADPTRALHTFAGWDKTFANITANTDVKATYTAD